MRLIMLIYLTLMPAFLFGQQYEKKWSSESDYRNSEDEIAEKIIWLEENPFSTNVNDTKALSNYVLDWVAGAPHIQVVMEEWFTSDFTSNKKYKYSDKLRVTYLFGKSLYYIQNPDDQDPVKASIRGLEGVVRIYNEILDRDKEAKHQTLDYYSYLYKSKRLEEYVSREYPDFGS